jgi:putative spermidine/putrescine transport system permease protein
MLKFVHPHQLSAMPALSSWKTWQPYLLASPQTLVFLLFLVFPLLTIFVVSFWSFNGYSMTPGFTLDNYIGILTSKVTLATYLNTFKFVGLVWWFTVAIAYPVAYFLAFHIKRLRWQVILFLVCTIPFLTSNIIRMISWIPFLGREGVINQTLMALRLTDKPVEMFLFSDFSVILAMVHLYVLYMVAPIFNSMMRIDRSLITAAEDAGASPLQVQQEIILPLAAPGIAIGSIFVVTLTMGEFATVRLMSGGQASSVGYLIKNQIGSLQYPLAAANAMILLAITLLLVFTILRIVDIRQEL